MHTEDKWPNKVRRLIVALCDRFPRAVAYTSGEDDAKEANSAAHHFYPARFPAHPELELLRHAQN